eukprot:PhF_6_TR625/c0_g1_i1/m.832
MILPLLQRPTQQQLSHTHVTSVQWMLLTSWGLGSIGVFQCLCLCCIWRLFRMCLGDFLRCVGLFRLIRGRWMTKRSAKVKSLLLGYVEALNLKCFGGGLWVYRRISSEVWQPWMQKMRTWHQCRRPNQKEKS